VNDIEQLAHDMRADSDLRDAVAMTLAVSPPGDWSALTDRLSSIGYGVSADELQDKLRSIHEPGTPHAEFLTQWL
jgi:hypothetical protein